MKQPQDHKLKVVPHALAQKPAWVPPQVTSQALIFEDMPGFGFDVLVVNGVEVYRACNFVQMPSGLARAIPMGKTAIFFSRQEAEAFKEQVKADAQKPRLVLPGQPGWPK